MTGPARIWRTGRRWVMLAALAAVPCLLYTVIAERMSWGPRTLCQGIGSPHLILADHGRLLLIDGMPDFEGINGTLRVWDVDNLSLVRTFQLGAESSLHATVGQNGTMMAEATSFGTIRLWDLATGQRTGTLVAPPHTTDVAGLSPSPDGRTMATRCSRGDCAGPDGDGSCESRILLWDVNTKSVRATLADQLLSHKFPIRELAFSPDGARLAGTDWDTCYVWDTRRGRLLWRKSKVFDHSYSGLAFSPDSQTLATMDEDTLRFWDVANGQLECRPDRFAPVLQSADGTARLVFSHDGQFLVILKSNAVYVLAKIPGGWARRPVTGTFYNDVVVSPDSRTLALMEYDTVALYDLQSGQRLRTIAIHHMVATALAFTTDGNSLVVAWNDGTVRLLRMR